MILQAILGKVGVPLLFTGLGAFGGMVLHNKMLTPDCVQSPCPPAPDCNCPAAVTLETFGDIDKIKNNRGHFHLHQELKDVQVVINCEDSLFLKKLMLNGSTGSKK